MGEAGLAESGRTVKKDVVDRFAPPLSRRNSYLEVFLRFFLPDKIGQAAGAETVLKRLILFARFTGYYACDFASPPILSRLRFSMINFSPLAGEIE